MVAPQKLGPTKKKNKRKAQQTSSKPQKRAKVEPEPKPAVKAKPAKPRNKGISKKTVDIVENDDRDLSDEDVDNFDEYEHFQGFLQDLKPEELAKKVQKPKVQTRPAPEPVVTRIEADVAEYGMSEDDEGFSSDLNTDSEADFDEMEEDVVSDEDDDDEPGTDEESVEDAALSDQEQDYELRPRRLKESWKGPESNRLPIKTKDGRVESYNIPDLPPVKEEYPESEVATQPRDLEPIRTLKTEDEDTKPLSDREQIIQTKEKLASVAQNIIEDPEENIEQLARLREIQSQGDLTEKKLAILTQTAVYKDIIPGYRIRALTEVEKVEKVTKEVRRLRYFEQALITVYQDFVNSLMNYTKTSRKSSGELTPAAQELKAVAVSSACSLLTAVPHFNFRTELFNIVIAQIVKKTVDDMFIQCRNTLQEIFREDEDGNASFEAMRLLCKKMKDRQYQVDESTVGAFLHLRLLTELDARGSADKIDRSKEKKKKKDRIFRTKKTKKFMKEQKEVEKDLREAEAVVDSETRERLQGETLKLAFTTYFRILKEGSRYIMGAALEGLAKFAHLINIDFFGDLLQVLRELMTESEDNPQQLSTRDTLLCTVTAFALLSGQGGTKETINLDLSQFMNSLYTVLLPLALNPDVALGSKSQRLEDPNNEAPLIKSRVNVSTESELLLRAMDNGNAQRISFPPTDLVVFFKQQHPGTTRLSAFVKRLLLVSLHFPEKSSAACLELTRRLLSRHTKLYGLFSSEESAGDGAYNYETDTPELSNPAATTVWELALYRQHFSPKVSAGAEALLVSLRESALRK